MANKLKYIVILLFFGLKSNAQCNGTYGSIVISEVHFDTQYDEKLEARYHSFGEYIELYNSSNSPVDLDGWVIKDNHTEFRLSTYENGGIIQPGGYKIITFGSFHAYGQIYAGSVINTGEPSAIGGIEKFIELFPEAAGHEQDIILQNTMVLDNDVDKVSLYNGSGKLINEVSFINGYGSSIYTNPTPLDFLRINEFTVDVNPVIYNVGLDYHIPFNYPVGNIPQIDLLGNIVYQSDGVTPVLIPKPEYKQAIYLTTLNNGYYSDHTALDYQVAVATPFSIPYTIPLLEVDPLLQLPSGFNNPFNAVESISYDINTGAIDGHSKSYFDDLGKPTVSMSIDVLNNTTWGTEKVYDSFGRIAKESFPAISCFGLSKINFLSDPTSKSTFLDRYYSNSNTDDPYQATATQPYTEVEYDKLNPGNVIKSFGGNQIAGEWKSGYSYTVPAAQEMYYLFGHNFFNGPMVSGKEEIITKFYKTVSVDANGVENVAFSDGEGKTLAVARSGLTTPATINPYPVHSLIGTQGYVDVCIPPGITSGITLLGGAINYDVYNLRQNTGIPTTAPLTGGNCYRIVAKVAPTTDPKVYVTQSTGALSFDSGSKGISYSVNYYDYSFNIYDTTGRLKKAVQPNGFRSVYATTPATFTITAAPAYMPDTFTNFSTSYKYNTLGQLIEVNSKDEGLSKFAYRSDGQIRYSQSALQANNIAPIIPSSFKVSYTNYDNLSRPIESGVLTKTTSDIWSNAIANVDNSAPLLPGTTASERTFTIYDYVANTTGLTVTIPASLSLATLAPTYAANQKNLAGNVAVTYKADLGTTITNVTWYSYDIYGRVEWMVQNINGLGLKTIHYNYDANGNVKKVIYQNDSTTEKFEHVYTYDMNSQLLQVQTSFNNGSLVTNANYSYYIDGSLKRTNIANGLQGLDYVYTLGGMLKSINHPSLLASNDPGGDSNDVFGVMLDYYDGDYSRPSKPQINTSPSVSGANANNYDGNIKAIRYANRALDLSGSNIVPKAFVYNYNDKKWLTNARYGTPNNSTGLITLDASNKYNEGNINYDANGNITTLTRRNQSGTITDNLLYAYNPGKNQLNRVADNGLATPTDLTDLENQSVNNYGYNAIGQMTSNAQENLTYEYNALGLVSKVKKSGNTLVEFYYNERGERYKKVVPGTGGSTEYYINDVSGTSMAIYKQQTGLPQLKDLTVYGVERLGVFTVGSSSFYQYEIADHLGNVRAVIRQPSGGGTTPTINSYADYYPFGELLPGRNVFSNYRYAFQGQELDSETGMEAFKLRLWDGRIGRWLSPDPYGQFYSPYLGMGNNPIGMIDLDGGISFGFDHFKFYKGFGKGVWGGLKGLGKSLYYLGDTAEGLVQFGLTGLASSGPNPYMSTLGFDSIFGTHTNQNYMDMNNKLSKFGNDLISSNPETSGEAWGNLAFSLLGTKGLGTLTKTKTFVNVSSKAKNVVNLTNKVDDVVNISDDAFVHVTTPGGAKNILAKGLNPEISGYVTKWKYVKNVKNPSDFNTMLYSQKLWPASAGKFDNGFNILQINAKPKFFSPRTNWVDGVPQYRFFEIVSPEKINLIK